MSNTNTKVIRSFISFAVVATLAATYLYLNPTSAVTCTTSPCSTTFEVNVKETLSVAVTTPTEWATGDANEFLRNKVSIEVTSNNSTGFTASMYSQDTTNLTNTTRSNVTMPTLASYSVKSSFPANYWGYSLGSGTTGTGITYNETDAGNNSSRYYPLATSSSPIQILTGTSSASQDIYFGAKANMSQASGTYAGTVIISVVTGTINENTNPITPTNPATPSSNEGTAAYTSAPTGGSNGSTVYTYTRVNSSTNTSTTTTQVSDGDNVSSYSGYQPPQGAIENTISKVVNESSLAAGLATTASVAAATGMFFFIVAKRKEDEEEEEESLI